MSVLIFLPPLATTLKVEGLASEGSPFTEDFSKLKGAGFKLKEAITEDDAIFFWYGQQNKFLCDNKNRSHRGLVIVFVPRGMEFVVESRI